MFWLLIHVEQNISLACTKSGDPNEPSCETKLGDPRGVSGAGGGSVIWPFYEDIR